jgi:hypothetical protein
LPLLLHPYRSLLANTSPLCTCCLRPLLRLLLLLLLLFLLALL